MNWVWIEGGVNDIVIQNTTKVSINLEFNLYFQKRLSLVNKYGLCSSIDVNQHNFYSSGINATKQYKSYDETLFYMYLQADPMSNIDTTKTMNSNSENCCDFKMVGGVEYVKVGAVCY